MCIIRVFSVLSGVKYYVRSGAFSNNWEVLKKGVVYVFQST